MAAAPSPPGWVGLHPGGSPGKQHGKWAPENGWDVVGRNTRTFPFGEKSRFFRCDTVSFREGNVLIFIFRGKKDSSVVGCSCVFYKVKVRKF